MGEVAENALDAMISLTGRGYPTGWFMSDRAYFPNAKAEKLQLPLRAMGYQLVGDYRDDQLGIQAEYAGAIFVEGSWYCPSMPQSLIDAAKYAQDVQFQSKEWRALYGLRNTVETFNAYTKSPTDENLEEPARRRVRGYAFQVLLLSAMVSASNLRKINSWIKKRNEPA